jgi:hypothetical protein
MKEVCAYLLLVVIGLLAVIEIIIDIAYMLMRGIRRGYKKALAMLILAADKWFNEKKKAYHFVSRKSDEDITYLVFNYDED